MVRLPAVNSNTARDALQVDTRKKALEDGNGNNDNNTVADNRGDHGNDDEQCNAIDF